jgi:cytochrome c-type biogenesis protein CcmH
MSGWIIIIAIAVVSFAVLVKLSKLPRITWEPLAAAILLAIAGYAYQGSPSQMGAPSNKVAEKSKAVEAVIDMRANMDQNFSNARPYLILSDSFARSGKYALAASYIRSGIRRHPKDADLWAGLGVQLILANDGKMSQPALLAFERVRKLSARHPAPDYFIGLDNVFEGKPDQALILWRKLLVDPPPNGKWVPKLESQVKGLAQMIDAASVPATPVK